MNEKKILRKVKNETVLALIMAFAGYLLSGKSAGYVGEAIFIGLLFVICAVAISIKVMTMTVQYRYYITLCSFVQYVFLATAFRIRIGNTAVYKARGFVLPEFAIAAIISIVTVILFNKLSALFEKKIMAILGAVVSIFFLLISMGAKKTGISIGGGLRVQVLVFIVIIDIVIVGGNLLSCSEKAFFRNSFVFWGIIGIQALLFLKASECGTLLLVLISAFFVYAAALISQKRIGVLAAMLIGAGLAVYNVGKYIKEVYTEYLEAPKESYGLFENIAIKAAKRLFQVDKYQYRRGMQAILMSRGRGISSGDYILSIPAGDTDFAFVNAIQIVGFVPMVILSLLMIKMLMNIIFMNSDSVLYFKNAQPTQYQYTGGKDKAVQIRDAGIAAFLVASFVISLFSQLSGIIIGIPTLFLSRATTWNMTALCLFVITITAPDVSRSTINKADEVYSKYMKNAS